jgi:hypothetical protein
VSDPIQAIFDQRNRERQALDAWREQVRTHVAAALARFEPGIEELRASAADDETISGSVLELIIQAMRTTLLTGLINTLQISVVAGRPLDAVTASLYPMDKMFAVIQEEVPQS